MSASLSEPISAAILTGGMSRRMGTDKALLDVGGTSILERTIGVLSVLSDDVLIIGDRAEYHGFGAAVVADEYRGTGPLGGIATALANARYPFVLVVGCDMPYLSQDLLAALARLPRNYDALVPLLPGPRGHRYEPLHAIYAVQCRSTIESAIEAEDLRLHAVLNTLQVQTVDAHFVSRFDPRRRSFTNVNTPHELQQALKREGGSDDS